MKRTQRPHGPDRVKNRVECDLDEVLCQSPCSDAERDDEGEGDAASVVCAIDEASWQDPLDSEDFLDEKDYCYGGAHFPPTIEI